MPKSGDYLSLKKLIYLYNLPAIIQDWIVREHAYKREKTFFDFVPSCYLNTKQHSWLMMFRDDILWLLLTCDIKPYNFKKLGNRPYGSSKLRSHRLYEERYNNSNLENLTLENFDTFGSTREIYPLLLSFDIDYEISLDNVKKQLGLYLDRVADDNFLTSSQYKPFEKQKDEAIEKIKELYDKTSNKNMVLEPNNFKYPDKIRFFEIFLILEKEMYIKIFDFSLIKNKSINAIHILIGNKLLGIIEKEKFSLEFRVDGSLIETNRNILINKYKESDFTFAVCKYIFQSKNRKRWIPFDEIANSAENMEIKYLPSAKNYKQSVYDSIRKLNEWSEKKLGAGMKIITNDGKNKYKLNY